MLPTVEWQDDAIVMIDQRKLPGAEVYVKCRTAKEVARAIKTMVIRGAPAIGVAAAMGLALGMKKSKATGTVKFAAEFQKTCDLLAATRPTAVNLFWAIDRMKKCLGAAVQAGSSVDEVKVRLEAEARAIHDEDVAACRAMGRFGGELVPAKARILTHCNAGALATAGYGTALGVIRGAIELGKQVSVFADETRPFLQGARLTAWELTNDGIDTTVITDNMAATFMRQGMIDVVVVGADRIAANGDVANKVGTYGVAVLAKEHGIPFYVAAPTSTLDLATECGAGIPIEERPDREVTHVGTTRLTPVGAKVRNPAFDVTPARYVTAIITERGVWKAPYEESLREAVRHVSRFGLSVPTTAMQLIGIESSCDETAAAVVAEVDDRARPWQIKSSVVASQVEIHREWGGVVPELASRQHVRDICGVVERALTEAGIGIGDPREIGAAIDAVAVTEGPGLVGSLLVGLQFAKSLAASIGKPLVPVHHLAGHIESLFLQNGPLPLPAVVLVVSGGHTSLYLVPEVGVYRLIARTRDDAAGEAYDKVAKLLGLGYPGGPVIDKLAREGNDRAIAFPTTRITHRDRNAPGEAGRLDFSFSGIKTAVLRYVRAREGFTQAEVADICASFQRVVVEALVDRLFEAAWRSGARSVGIAGGVSANARLRNDAAARGEELGLPVFLPTLALSTDNAAMIAAAGLRRFRAGVTAGWDLNADAALKL